MRQRFDWYSRLIHKVADGLSIGDVESHGAGFRLSVLSDEVVESILAATNGDDFGAFLNEAIGHGSADAGRGTDHEDVFVWKRHLDCVRIESILVMRTRNFLELVW